MPKDAGEDIRYIEQKLGAITLISEQIKVLIIGGGNAGLIKARSFGRRGYKVTVLSKNYKEEFYELAQQVNLCLIQGEYSKDYIEKHHIIIIAVEDQKLIEEIKSYCDEKCKLYLTCHDFREGNFIVPTQGRLKNIHFSLNTFQGNPIASLFLLEKIKEYLQEYDDLVGYASKLRKKFKRNKDFKEMMKFICSDDFFEFYKAGYGEEMIQLFYPKKK